MEDFAVKLKEHVRRLGLVEERGSEHGDIRAFFVGRIEFLHFHGANAFDLRLPPPLVDLEVARGGVRRHGLEHASRDGWVVVEVRTSHDFKRAKDLITKAHAGALRLAGT